MEVKDKVNQSMLLMAVFTVGVMIGVVMMFMSIVTPIGQ